METKEIFNKMIKAINNCFYSMLSASLKKQKIAESETNTTKKTWLNWLKDRKTENWRNNINKFEKDIIMATLREIGKKYGKYLKDTELIGYLSIVEIEEKINKLTYSTTGKPITTDDKLKVVDYIKEELNIERTIKNPRRKRTGYKTSKVVLRPCGVVNEETAASSGELTPKGLNESESIDALLNLIAELTNNIKNGK